MLVDEPIIMLSLLVNAGGLICSITAVLCLLINPTIEQSLRAILVSFTLSNVAGSGMLVFGVFKYASHRSDQHSLDYIVMMAVVMSLSHILLLILHYYIALTTSKKKMALDFSGNPKTSFAYFRRCSPEISEGRPIFHATSRLFKKSHVF